MENCPLNGKPCMHKKCIHVTEVGKDYKATDAKDMCLLCGLDYIEQGEEKPSIPLEVASIISFITQAAKTKMPVKTCSVCGYTLQDISKTGRIGCAKCYDCFREELKKLLLNYHGSTQHIGKKPKGQIPVRTVQQMELELKEAIKKEDYELAAKLRDEIKQGLPQFPS